MRDVGTIPSPCGTPDAAPSPPKASRTASTDPCEPSGESMHILQELLDPIPVHEFLHRTFTRVPCAMPDRARRYTQDFTEADIAAIVDTGRSVLRIVHNGRLVHDHARLSWREAQAYYRRG